MTPQRPESQAERLVNALRKAGEGITPEQFEAWKADIDRARHPFDYIDRPSDALLQKAKSPPDVPNEPNRPDEKLSPGSEQHSLKDFISRLRKLTEGKTPEEIEAWKADIDRARHPFDYIDRPSDALLQKAKSPPNVQNEPNRPDEK